MFILFPEKGQGTSTPQLTVPELKEKIIPICSFEMQRKIVEYINQIFLSLGKIEEEKSFINELVNMAKVKVLEEIFSNNSSYKSYYENYKNIGDLFKTISTVNKEEKTKDVLEIGKYPVVSQSKCLIDGYSNCTTKVIYESPVIIFGDHTRIVKYIDFPFIPGADGTKILKSTILDDKYFFYCVLYASLKIENRGYGRHFSRLKEIVVPIPSNDKQKQIVFQIEKAFSLKKIAQLARFLLIIYLCFNLYMICKSEPIW
jgi:type I restriction enzyme S subunit